jgi:hypothetical protein
LIRRPIAATLAAWTVGASLAFAVFAVAHVVLTAQSAGHRCTIATRIRDGPADLGVHGRGAVDSATALQPGSGQAVPSQQTQCCRWPPPLTRWRHCGRPVDLARSELPARPGQRPGAVDIISAMSYGFHMI